MAGRLEGKTALITGAAAGIGRATALRFAAEGARVMASDINAQALELVNGELGGEARSCVIDTADEAQVQRAINTTVEAFGRLDILVNNAGVAGGADWDRTIAVNLSGVYYGCKHGVIAMGAQGGGSIVNLSSMLGLISVPLPPVEAYTAAKHGVVGLTRTAASEVAQRGVRVNCVMPGVIETPLLMEVIEKMFPGDAQRGLQKLGQAATLNRCGRPEEVGSVVSFLLSDEASFVNGASWEVDGGALATIRNDLD